MSFWGKDSRFLRWGVSCLFVALSVGTTCTGTLYAPQKMGELRVQCIKIRAPEGKAPFSRITVTPIGNQYKGQQVGTDHVAYNGNGLCVFGFDKDNTTRTGPFYPKFRLTYPQTKNAAYTVRAPQEGEKITLIDTDFLLTRQLFLELKKKMPASFSAGLRSICKDEKAIEQFFEEQCPQEGGNLLTGELDTLKLHYYTMCNQESGFVVRINPHRHTFNVLSLSDFFENNQTVLQSILPKNTGQIVADRVVRPTGSGSVSDQYWPSTENLLALSLGEQPTTSVQSHSHSFGDVNGATQAYPQMAASTDRFITGGSVDLILQQVKSLKKQISSVSIGKGNVRLVLQGGTKVSLPAEFKCMCGSDNYTSTFCFKSDGEELRMETLTPNPEKGSSLVTDGGAHAKVCSDSKKVLEQALMNKLAEAQNLA